MTDFTSEIEKISSKQGFVVFVEMLTQDFKENSENWENNSLGLYLEGISSWTDDMEGYYENNKIDITKLNQWQIFANILVAASVYE